MIWVPQKHYSGELGSQNGSKIEPKMEPSRQRPTLTKHAQALSDHTSTPLLDVPFSLPRRALEKTHKNRQSNGTKTHNGSNVDPKLERKGVRRHLGGDFARKPCLFGANPFWGSRVWIFSITIINSAFNHQFNHQLVIERGRAGPPPVQSQVQSPTEH